MVPQLADWAMGDMLVDVVSEHDGETREKRAAKVHCPVCGRTYDDMTWQPTETPDVPALVCPCGEVFPLSISTRA